MRYTSFFSAVLVSATLTVILSSCTPARKVDRYQYLLENRSKTSDPIASRPDRQERPQRKNPTRKRNRPIRSNNKDQSGLVYTHDRNSDQGNNSQVVVIRHRPNESRPSRNPRNNPDHPSKILTSSERDLYIQRDTEQVIRTAKSYMGVPYLYGGMSRSGMDCSALVCLSYKSVDKNLPRTSVTQAQSGKTIPKNKIQPGHLIFFATNKNNKINHVGIVTNVYNGEIEFIHATSSRGVRIDKLSHDYWRPRYVKAVAPLGG